jgi:aldose 1-epimerase
MQSASFSSIQRLAVGDWVCDVCASLGGSVIALTFCGEAVFATTPSGSYPLVPYSNRIANAKLQWAGQHYNLVPNFVPEPHAIHGVGWQRAWTITSFTETTLELCYRHIPDVSWPFAFEAVQTFELSANGLRQVMSMQNLSTFDVPAGLGWHPYFKKRQSSHLCFSAKRRWEMGDDFLPTHPLSSSGLDRNCDALTIDHCFDGCLVNGQNLVVLEDSVMRVSISSDVDCLVVYTKPSLDSIAIEPVSHVNNAFNQKSEGLGVRVLDPGETTSASFQVRCELLMPQ